MPKLSKCPGVKFPEKYGDGYFGPIASRTWDDALTLADRNVCLDVGKARKIISKTIRESKLIDMLNIDEWWVNQIAQALNERLAEILIEEEKQ